VFADLEESMNLRELISAGLAGIVGLATVADMPTLQGGGKAKVEVVGLHVNKAPYKEDKELVTSMEPAPGIRLDLLVTIDEPGIIKLDEKKCKISRFADEKGTDLLGKKGGAKDDASMDSGPIGPFPKVSKDLKACLVSVEVKAAPAAGAKTLLLEGGLALVVGKGQEVAKQEKVELKKGAALKVGSIGLQIEAAGKPDFGDAAMQVTLSSKDGAKVARLRFLDSGGKEIESKPGGSNSMSSGGETTYSWSYDFTQELKVITVEATLWKQVVTVDVPVKLSLSVGF
jgi:hypothetical protein